MIPRALFFYYFYRAIKGNKKKAEKRMILPYGRRIPCCVIAKSRRIRR